MQHEDLNLLGLFVFSLPSSSCITRTVVIQSWFKIDRVPIEVMLFFVRFQLSFILALKQIVSASVRQKMNQQQF